MAFCKDCKTEVEPRVEHDSDGDDMYVRQFTVVTCPDCGGQGLFHDEEYIQPYEWEPPEPLIDDD